MKQTLSLSIVLVVLVLLFLMIPYWLLPKLPPHENRGLCTTCHWEEQALPAHQSTSFTDESCLACHNPHTHMGRPYLPGVESCLVCHFEYKSKPGFTVHKPVGEVQCTSCHQPHKLFEPSRLVTDQDKLCNSCHRDDMKLFPDPVGHMPYERRQCLSCHDAHMTKEADLLRQPLDLLCRSCHRQVDEQRRPFQHLPFERDKCMDCHVPHASGFRGLTKMDQTRLCYSCHFDRKDELKRAYKHGPYGKGYCTDCHEPHSAAAKNLIPHEKEEEFCFSCHTDVKERGWYGSAHSTSFAENKVCLSCHEKHSSDYPFLSRFPIDGKGSLCLYCHDQIGSNYFLSAHAFLRCGQCHEIHGSAEPALLDAVELELCNRCHPDLMLRSSNHPVGTNYEDTVRKRSLLCSSCHSPHGTRYTKMKLRDGNNLCIPCHTDIQ
jgi:predicted CXXCH cytochrome family protein